MIEILLGRKGDELRRGRNDMLMVDVQVLLSRWGNGLRSGDRNAILVMKIALNRDGSLVRVADFVLADVRLVGSGRADEEIVRVFGVTRRYEYHRKRLSQRQQRHS